MMRKVYIIGIPQDEIKSSPPDDTFDFNCTLDEAELVFVWIPPHLEESGVDLLKDLTWAGKKIFAASPRPLEQVEAFFGMSNYLSDKDDPIEAFNFFILTVLLLDLIGSHCESPIEKLFWDEICWIFRGIIPQVKIGRYRADFAVENLKIVIEIDGHDYHKSKVQRTRDAERQRDLEGQGWRVIRFTGSEIFADPRGCAIEAFVLAVKWLSAINLPESVDQQR